MKGLFVAIAGPSGVGKGTIVDLLRKRVPGLQFVLSMTTREIRPGEQDGVQYHFVGKEEFEKRIAAGEFLEYAQVHQKDYYGILKAPVEEALRSGKVVVREVDVQGMESLLKIIPRDQLLTIFILPENMNVLRQRIEKRGVMPEEEMKRRMESEEKELAEAKRFDYRLTNYEGRVEACYLDVEGVIFSRAQQMGLPFLDMKRS